MAPSIVEISNNKFDTLTIKKRLINPPTRTNYLLTTPNKNLEQSFWWKQKKTSDINHLNNQYIQQYEIVMA